MKKFSFFVFAFLFAGILTHFSSASDSLIWHHEALDNACNNFVKSVVNDLRKAKIVFDKLMSLEKAPFPLFEFEELSTCENALGNYAHMLRNYRCHKSDLIDRLESEIRGVFLSFMRCVSFWFIRDTEALLDFVNLNKNMSLRTLFESTRKLSHSDSSLSYILQEINALPFGLIMVTLDLGKDWNTTETHPDFSGEPNSKVENNNDWLDIGTRLSSLREFLSKACKIHFFPKDNGFLEQLEESILYRLEKFVFNGEDASAFEIWYRDSYSHFSPFLSHGYIDNYSACLIEVDMLEKSVTDVELCLESLKEEIKIPNAFDFTKISLFFDKFDYASFRLNTSHTLDKVKYFNSGLKRFLSGFYCKILLPLYSGRRRSELLTFLKSGNLKLIYFIFELLNAEIDYDIISIENDKTLSEAIYFNAFKLIKYEFNWRAIDTGAKWDEFKLFISNFANILESLPEFVPKGIYAGTSMPIKNYIASLRYLIDNAKFDEKSGIFDVIPFKSALSSIAEIKKDSVYHCQVTLVIFYLIRYYGRVKIGLELGYPFLFAIHKVHISQLDNEAFWNFYVDIDNIRELLHSIKGATFTKTCMNLDEWSINLEWLLKFFRQRNANDNADDNAPPF